MAFDFRARAIKREADEDAARRRENEAYRKREDTAESLKVCMLDYAKDLYRDDMKAERRGTVVIFTDDWKVAEVAVESPSSFTFVDQGKQPGVTRSTTGAVQTGLSETALMDKLDAWARMK